MKHFSFYNKTAIVTGASSGIGKCICEILNQKYNVKIIGVSRNLDKLLSVKSQLKNPNLFTPFNFDVGSLDGWKLLKTYLLNNSILPDILINCAGILPKFSAFLNGETDVLNVVNTNFLSVVYSAQEILPLITKNGVMINVSSSASLCPFGGIAMYSATKSATKSFCEALRHEVKDVSVSLVMPGFTKTDILKEQTLYKNEQKYIDFISSNPYAVAKKILKKSSRRKGRIVIGKDAHLMSFLYRLFPSFAPKIITSVIKKSKFKIFNKV